MVQYHHTEISARKTPRKGSAGSRDAGSEYELVLAVSSIRMQVYGEDFQDFMHRGATQCSSFHAYMDLFCYQAPSSRSSPPTFSYVGPCMSVPKTWRCKDTTQEDRSFILSQVGIDAVLSPRREVSHCRPACCRKHGWALPQQLLSFRTVSTRTTLLQRSSRDGEAMQEYADPQMQAMAQVWAHPEDLPLYPVSPLELAGLLCILLCDGSSGTLLAHP